MSDRSPGTESHLRRLAARCWGWTKVVGQLFVITLAVELANRIGPLQELQAYFAEHPRPWVAICIATTAVGLALLIYVWGSLIFSSASASLPTARWPGPSARQKGRQRPRTRARVTAMHNAASFADIKQAFLDGSFLTDPGVRPFCIGTIGVMLAMMGSFSFFFFVGPPAAQILCSVAVVYALTRTLWAFWKA